MHISIIIILNFSDAMDDEYFKIRIKNIKFLEMCQQKIITIRFIGV